MCFIPLGRSVLSADSADVLADEQSPFLRIEPLELYRVHTNRSMMEGRTTAF
ncbi:hypothetical protein KU306_17890 (plasmid) [Haloferax larsenii]|uniref:Uncharacterized protein n=1 Tax=Haloferax larsenii TaxID=302484 RepID=A0ABY5RJD8_HALLR|nr:hypothetical protein [Haloferax larsenii]UVE52481.1 hypothetical protein KU306_17890 [Haloferax larsenii]